MTHPAILEETDTSVLKAALVALQIKSQNWSEIDLNRQATKKDHKWLSEKGLEHPHLGFEWGSADNATPNWYPQGITGLRSDASENAEHRYLVISWYGKNENSQKGVRLSFVDVSDMNNIKYRHVLLVEPSGDASVYKPIKIHAGGLATRGSTLFLVDTQRGVRAFDARWIFSAEADLPDKKRCGIIDGKAFAFDYRYILPQSKIYRMSMSEDDGEQNFSFASVDWTDKSHPLLMTGNYHSNGSSYQYPPAKVVWWNLDGFRITTAAKSFLTNVTRTRGVVCVDGQLWLSRSGSRGEQALVKIKLPNSSSETHQWPYGCEDLHYSPYSKNVWCLTEHPDLRFVFAIKSESYT